MCSKTYNFFSITIAIRILQELFYEEMEYCTFFLFFFFTKRNTVFFMDLTRKVWLFEQISWLPKSPEVKRHKCRIMIWNCLINLNPQAVPLCKAKEFMSLNINSLFYVLISTLTFLSEMYIWSLPWWFLPFAFAKVSALCAAPGSWAETGEVGFLWWWQLPETTERRRNHMHIK